MELLDGVLILLAGVAAGTINSVVGSGTLITFPTLLALGYPPVLANVSNTVGLVPGTFAGAWGYRSELAGQRSRVIRFGALAAVGGLSGGVCLLLLPEDAFATIVPVLIALAVFLVIIQPWLSRRLAERQERHAHGGPWLLVGLLLTSAYGGYFGAGQGVLMIAIMAVALSEPLQRINAIKNVLTSLVNLLAGVLFVLVADIDWAVVGMIAVGSIGGGLLGARIGRLLPAAVLRGVIVVIGVIAVVTLIA